MNINDEARQVVETINLAILVHHENIEHDYTALLEFCEVGYLGCAIKWAGRIIWSSENDLRDYDENDDQEPLLKFVCNEMLLLRDKMFIPSIEQIEGD